MKKGIVISGGGSWGAFTVGRLAVNKPKVDYVIGCSTGSLIAPFVLLEKWDELIFLYSNVEDSDIFSTNPFKQNGNIKIFQALKRLILGKKTLGETLSLKSMILKYFTKEMFEELKFKNKECIVTVCNIDNPYRSTEFINSKDCIYEVFCDYMFASCCVPLVTTLVEINGNNYCDGGTLEGVPIQQAVKDNCTELDVYLHNVEFKKPYKPIKNILHFSARLFNLMRQEIKKDDMSIGNFNNNVSIKYKYLPYELNLRLLRFNKEQMRMWIIEGINYEESLKVSI